MNVFSASVLSGLATFVVTWIIVMIAARRDQMSALMQVLAVVVVGVLGVALAATLRILASGLADQENGWTAAAMVLGSLWPLWQFVQLNLKSK